MTTIFGWDASHYDQVPDGNRVVSEGFQFMTHKAGGDQDDQELAAWWRAMQPHRQDILLGAYWVLYPNNPSGRADMFLDRLDSQCPGWRNGPFILQADCEKWNNNSATAPSVLEIRSFCARLVQRVPKYRPIVYAPAWFYAGRLAGLGYPIWSSKYPSSTPGYASTVYAAAGGDSGPGWAPYSGITPSIWQFTDAATIAGQSTCDADAFRGTRADLSDLVSPGWPTMNQADIDAIVQGVLNAPIGNKRYPQRTVQMALNDLSGERDAWCDPKVGAADLDPTTPAAKAIAQVNKAAGS